MPQDSIDHGACRVIEQILRWVIDPLVLVSVAFLLAFCLAVVLMQKHGKSVGLQAMRREFYRYRRDMQSKVGDIQAMLQAQLIFLRSCS